MGFVITIIVTMLSADVWWWYVADRAVRRANLGARYRVIVGVTMGSTLLGLVLLLFARIIGMQAMIMPETAVIVTFVWHFMILPLVAIPSLLAYLVGALCRIPLLFPGIKAMWKQAVGWWHRRRQSSAAATDEPLMDRRAFLTRAIVVAPPIATLALTGRSVQNLDDLIVRHDTVAISNLPPALDGMRIAHVSDPHIGSFMSEEKYQRIIRMTNDLDADLVLQTGDLINSSLHDLPDGIQMLKSFRSKFGVYSCQGNHDCIDSRKQFESDTVKADVGMLLDEIRTIDVRGQKVNLISPRWHGREDSLIRWSVKQLADSRPSDGWSILMAHHPHAFDAATDSGIPLTLAGHTHGGQLALTKNIGFGPMMYRYWQGLYRNGNSVLNVSAGMGNWFPLRLGMPCEIVNLTLRRA